MVAEWEKRWIQEEEEVLGRPPRGSPIKSCEQCLEDIGLKCHAIPFAKHVRILNFEKFDVKSWSLDSIEECDFRKG